MPSERSVFDGSVNVERMLQISVATQAALGAIALGIGVRESTLPVLAAIVSVSSVYLTDRERLLVLGNSIANIAAVGAVALTLSDILIWGVDPLIATAKLLIYLQFILLYRKKRTHSYALLMTLSLMQIAVASALNFAASFGALLILFLFVGMTSLLLFHILRESVAFSVTPAPETDAVADPRWPLLSRSVRFAGHGHERASERVLPSGPWRTVFGIGTTTVLLAAVVFILVPRRGDRTWRQPGGSPARFVGATERVTLGEVGTLLESPEEVMKVQLTDLSSGEVFQTITDPLFRGVVLTRYRNGEWSPPNRSDNTSMDVSSRLSDPHLVRQDITIGAMESNSLFAVFPPYKTKDNANLRYDAQRNTLLRPIHMIDNRFAYELVTTGIVNRNQIRFIPPLQEDSIGRLMRWPENQLPNLSRLTSDIIADIDEGNRVAKALALEQHFQTSGNYVSTLDLKRGDMLLDPIEDFISNTRSGHCEYFASALTLMLRAAGVPARMVVGFKGGEWNPYGKFYQVRQLHAHAWVEAYIPPAQLPDDLPGPRSRWRMGAWLTLDPTPVAPGSDLVVARSNWTSLYQLVEYGRFLWSSYVLGLNAQRQEEVIYAPFRNAWFGLITFVTSADNWKRLAQLATDPFRGKEGKWFSEGWFNWRAGLIAVGVQLALVTIVWWLWRTARNWLARRARHAAGSAAQAAIVPFYHRLERVLKKHRFVRAPNTTQREFAGTLATDLKRLGLSDRLAYIPHRVVDAFYDVRFGGQRLDNERIRQVEQDIEHLESAISGSQPTVAEAT